MSLLAKLEKLRSTMKYYELIGQKTQNDTYWILRNVSTGAFASGSNRVEFVDSDLEVLIDRAIAYSENGPNQELLKAAYQVENIFKKRTLIQGDVIVILYDYINDDPDETIKLENKMTEMGFNHGRFPIEMGFNARDWNQRIWSISGLV